MSISKTIIQTRSGRREEALKVSILEPRYLGCYEVLMASVQRGVSLLALILLLASAWPLRAQDAVTSLAGQTLVSGGANGAGTNALFSDPAAMVADSPGNLFVADSGNHAIRKVSSAGLVTTFAGQLGVVGSGGTGAQAKFNRPCGIAMDRAGNLFVSDTGNHTIRKITPAGGVSTIAGSVGQSDFANGSGTTARFSSPLGLAVAADGTLYVADSGNHVIRVISPSGVVSTFAGSPENWGSDDGAGGVARFNGPVGVALNESGDLLVSDANNHTIRKVATSGVVATWAGTAGLDGCVDGNGRSARFCMPAELAVDRHGNVFLADSFNHVVRKISREGRVTTVTGLPGGGGAGDGANGQARLFNPYGLAVRPDGSLALADAYNQLLRIVLVPVGVSINVSGGGTGVVLAWDSVVGAAYQVQNRTSLDAGAWENVGTPITATSLNTTTSLGDSSLGQRMYRVRMIP